MFQLKIVRKNVLLSARPDQKCVEGLRSLDMPPSEECDLSLWKGKKKLKNVT